jgi:hypothetical protein
MQPARLAESSPVLVTGYKLLKEWEAKIMAGLERRFRLVHHTLKYLYLLLREFPITGDLFLL